MDCKCRVGILPDGSFCDCPMGEKQAEFEKRADRMRAGHGEPISPVGIIPERYRSNDAKALMELFRNDPKKRAALGKVGEWAKLPWVEQKKRNLFLWGPVGTGKTTIAYFTLGLFLRNGHRARGVYWSEWITLVDSLEYREGNAEVLELTKVPVLLLDDLGSQDREYQGDLQKETARRIDILRTVLNTRLSKGVPTIITTNLSPADFGRQWGPRIESRVSEDFWVQAVEGEDLRLRVGVNA